MASSYGWLNIPNEALTTTASSPTWRHSFSTI